MFVFAKEMLPWKQLIWCLSVKISLWLRPWHHYERHLFLSLFPLLDEHQNREKKLNLANCPTKWGRNEKSKCTLAVNVFKCSEEDQRVSRSSCLMFPCELCDSLSVLSQATIFIQHHSEMKDTVFKSYDVGVKKCYAITAPFLLNWPFVVDLC